jgi:hypothetical protein
VTGENADGPLDVMSCGRARFPRRQSRRGPGGSGLEGVGPGPRAAEVAHAPQGQPVECLARRRRSRVRPGCFSAGQPSVDRDFLQKIELCDKNGRYKSCI